MIGMIDGRKRGWKKKGSSHFASPVSIVKPDFNKVNREAYGSISV
jgi:hypothetical protein